MLADPTDIVFSVILTFVIGLLGGFASGWFRGYDAAVKIAERNPYENR